MLDPIPLNVKELIDKPQYREQAQLDVNIVSIRDGCAAVQNANPMYWNESYCLDVAGAQLAPVTQLSTWLRPYHWQPDCCEEQLSLRAHFDLKKLLMFPEAIITANELKFGVPVKLGDRLQTYQVLRSISDVKTNKLGTGRYWVLDVMFENQLGEFVGKDSYTAFAYQKEGGHSDI
jgi:hypothetical protein